MFAIDFEYYNVGFYLTYEELKLSGEYRSNWTIMGILSYL